MPKAIMQDETDFRPPQELVDEPTANVTDITSAVAAAIYDPVSALGPPGHLGGKPEIEKELDLIAAAIRTFHRKQPDQVMRECSGYSARLTEMAVLLHRVESTSRQYTRIRTQQVQRYLDELDRQWKTASRLVEVQRHDIELMR